LCFVAEDKNVAMIFYGNNAFGQNAELLPKFKLLPKL